MLQLRVLLIKGMNPALEIAYYLVFAAQRLLVKFALFAGLRVESF